MEQGRIIKGLGGLYTVKTDCGETECKARGVFRKDNITPMVGDYVEIENEVIINIKPRKNSLIRPPCSNIDKLLVVAATHDPNPNTLNIDKLTVIASYHCIEPVIILNKSDIGDEYGLEDIYKNLPMHFYKISAEKSPDREFDSIRNELYGCTAAFGGQSGVGKSSIINRLDKSLSLAIGDISRKTKRGRHTTRHVQLYKACGGMILDTPGFSSIILEFFDIKDRSRLAGCFPEFKPYVNRCKYSDCRHTKEDGCAVLEAVAKGEIPESRHKSYLSMFEELGEYRAWEDKKRAEKNV